ncbi:DUF4041 domain-containing protein [Phormidium sp. FACHB-1136]|uniref:DUF4041 domain-containing protein n=1 Tax=Phormidium sp. FACHB-1136 TaxID=2692848 RepID=UPI00168729D6|nr:DUF4041 domain-containing protein [Phormidium sp. FACHB-1136]MBD2426396.1 DUF4041 domain-containing protein [Phormidium sp. FACHB-1136]
MSFLLLLLTLGATTVAAILYQKLQSLQNERRIEQQKAKESIDQLQAFKEKYGDIISKAQAVQKLDNQIVITRDRLKEIQQQANLKEQEINHRIDVLSKKLEELEEKDFIEEFGFYESKYNFGSASEYKGRLDEIRSQQKKCLKNKKAAICNTEWTVSGSKKQGQKMVEGFLRLVLRAFNGECDAAIGKVKFNNVQTMENRISKAYETLNKLSETTHCEITEYYLQLKLDELYLVHEYQEKRQQEQEEQRIIREQMREEEKAAKEIEKARIEAEKEEKRYQEALEQARREAENARGSAQEKLLAKIQELQKRVDEAEANRQRAISQAQLTKSGYVYIISNIGSFGEDIYKIGMTRRLNPEDRISELSNASVPFPFDIHAMISCSNAPELESRLHKIFDDRRINSVNSRKEFFKVSLEEIVAAVQEIDKESSVCTSEVRITKVAEAAEYRKSLAKLRANE